MDIVKKKFNRRKNRVKHSVSSNNKSSRPCLYVFRSNCHIHAQLLSYGKVLAFASSVDKEFKEKNKKKTGIEKAIEVGRILAKKVIDQKINPMICMNKGGNAYHGRIEALAKGAREGGLKF